MILSKSFASGGSAMQFFRFALVGLGATLVQYVLFWCALKYIDAAAVFLSSAAYLAGSVASYFLNHRFTFASQQSHRSAVPKFYLMVALGWVLNAAVVALLVDYMLLNAWLGQLAATALSFLLNFVISRFFVFGGKS